VDQLHPPIAQKKHDNGGESNGEGVDDTGFGMTSLCHILALSGIPAREQLFSVNLCGRRGTHHHKRRRGTDEQFDVGVEGTAPLLVESLSSRRHRHRAMYDVVTAVNTGVVTRVSGSTGKVEWQSTILPKLLTSSTSYGVFSSSRTNDEYGLIPDWDDVGLPTLQRIDVRVHSTNSDDDDDDDYDEFGSSLAPAYRPILWTGEESMVLLSPINGNVIGYVAFPQPVVVRPIVIDFNGDGTSDVIVVTTDAIWGYRIKVQVVSSSLFQRILYGIVFFGLLVAFLQNQIQSQPGKRCTDL
jgi:hypothetical protein